MQAVQTTRWLFSAPADLALFLGSALLSLLLLVWGRSCDLVDSPDWVWVTGILLVDVAHVWSTGFRVYFDSEEVKRRPYLYISVPIIGYALGLALYSEGELVFWRVLAYVAVFHFVRQQYGWVALYRSRAGETDRWGHWIDSFAVYMATLYPLCYWHTQLPRKFAWFMQGDFWGGAPKLLLPLAETLYWVALALYLGSSIWNWSRGKGNPGKDVIIATTAVCWYTGIVLYDSDYTFTVTNVFIHGIPYVALIYSYGKRQAEARPERPLSKVFALGPWGVLGIVWVLAYMEELLWDRVVWHDKDWLFGSPWEVGGMRLLLVPLLALPQICHYVLDGFIWKRRETPELFNPAAPPCS